MRLSVLVESSNGALRPTPGTGVTADPPVTAVVTSDLLDPGRYLTGGELVLTGLAWWRPDSPERSQSFVESLVGAGAAALAAGEAELGRVPDDLVAACAAAGLPLLRVPVAHSFAELTVRATGLLGGGDLAAVLARHRVLMRAATTPDAGLPTVLELVGADLGAACWVLSPTGRLVHGPALDPRERRQLARQFLRATELPSVFARPGGRMVTLYGEPPRGATWLLAVDADRRRWSTEQQAVVAELAALVAVEHSLVTGRSAAERHLADALSGSDPGAVEAAATTCGLDPAEPAVVVVATGAAAVLLETLAEHATAWALGSVGSSSGVPAAPESLAVVSHAGDLVGQLRATLVTLAPGLGPGPVRIGVSDPVTGGAGLLAAVAQARYARAGADAGVAGPDRLSSHTALLGAVPAELRRAYRERVLGTLLEHDRVHRTELVHTLAEYLACSGSWSRCAAQMHVHVNTLRYRIERIEALTGRDLRRLTDQVDLLLALDAGA